MEGILIAYSSQEEYAVQREELLQLLHGHGMLLSWNGTHLWVFSVKNAYFRPNFGGLRCRVALVIWKVKAPLKIRAFLWVVINKLILTWDNLMKRNWQGPWFCVMCVAKEETVDHLFLRCPFTVHIWRQFGASSQDEHHAITINVNLHWTTWRYTSIYKRGRVLGDLSAAAIFWGI